MFILSKVLGNNYQAKILETLIENYNDEFIIPEIIEIAGTSRGSTYSFIKSLVREKIINKTRKISGTQLYKLNLENPATKALILLEHNLVTSELEKEIAEEARVPTDKYKKKVIAVIIDRKNKQKMPVIYSEPEDWAPIREIGGNVEWEIKQKVKK